jgi:hypothetical protein
MSETVAFRDVVSEYGERVEELAEWLNTELRVMHLEDLERLEELTRAHDSLFRRIRKANNPQRESWHHSRQRGNPG